MSQLNPDIVKLWSPDLRRSVLPRLNRDYGGTTGGLLDRVQELVRDAEDLVNMDGPDRKEWVIEALNAEIDVPLIGEGLEARLISLLVELVVALIRGE